MRSWRTPRQRPGTAGDMVRAPRADVALDGSAVVAVVAEAVERWAGFRPHAARARLLKRNDRRLVVRYRLIGLDRAVDVVGKWFATDRGALVERELRLLRAAATDGEPVAVPRPIAYADGVRALFVEAIDGPVLRELLRTDQDAARAAGEWLARFHRSAFISPRRCGPDKMRAAVTRWATEVPALAPVGELLQQRLRGAPDLRLPVHYDYYHSQAVRSRAGLVVLDLDECGLGDPAFDLAHFAAHLRLLALQWYGDAAAFDPAIAAFEDGYRAANGSADQLHPAVAAFAAFKLAYQALRGDAPAVERDLLLAEVSASLRSA
jgi:Phosphotransferase enzyme family